METTHTLFPKNTRHAKLTVTPKFNSSNGNMAFAKLRRTQSLDDTRCHLNLLNLLINPFRLLTISYSQSFLRDLQHKKQTKYSMLQIKAIPQNISTIGILLLRLSFIYPISFSEGPYKLSEETRQRKHTRIRYNILLAKNKTFPR